MKVGFPKTSCFKFHIILFFPGAALVDRGATGRSLAQHALGPGFKFSSGKTIFLAYSGVFKDGDLGYDNRFMTTHIALREKKFFLVKDCI